MLKAPTDVKLPNTTSPVVLPNEAVPATLKLPTLPCTKPSVVTKLPPTLNAPPLCWKAPKSTLPLTRKLPAVWFKVAPTALSWLSVTTPDCAGAMGLVLKVTVVPVGTTTTDTLSKSGTALPAQLAGSSHWPLLPPVHVTEAKRCTLALALPVLETM